MEFVLGGNWIDNLPPALAGEVRSLMRERTYADGQALFQQGDSGGPLFEVVRGQVNVMHCAANGVESLINVLVAGDCTGEQSLIDGLPRPNTAVARGRTEVRTLDRITFGRLRNEHREITEALLALVAWRFRFTLAMLNEQTEVRPTHRVGRRLVILAKAHGHPCAEGIAVETSLSQTEFAQWVGLSRQRVNKALQDLQREGLITLAARRMVIRDLAELEGRYA